MADDHKHGSMDTTSQQKTFDGFVKFTQNSVIIIFAILILLALFAT